MGTDPACRHSARPARAQRLRTPARQPGKAEQRRHAPGESPGRFSPGRTTSTSEGAALSRRRPPAQAYFPPRHFGCRRLLSPPAAPSAEPPAGRAGEGGRPWGDPRGRAEPGAAGGRRRDSPAAVPPPAPPAPQRGPAPRTRVVDVQLVGDALVAAAEDDEQLSDGDRAVPVAGARHRPREGGHPPPAQPGGGRRHLSAAPTTHRAAGAARRGRGSADVRAAGPCPARVPPRGRLRRSPGSARPLRSRGAPEPGRAPLWRGCPRAAHPARGLLGHRGGGVCASAWGTRSAAEPSQTCSTFFRFF